MWVAGAAVVIVVLVLAVGALNLTGSAAGTQAAATPLPSGAVGFQETNHSHVTGSVQYDHNPPAGGEHNAVWLNCGVYDQPVPNENAVHSLEHGSVWITYQPSLPASDVAQLRTFVESHYDGTQKYLILSPYPGIPSPIVASAWGAQLQLTSASDPRLAQFVAQFEGGAQGGEPGAACTGGTGTPIG